MDDSELENFVLTSPLQNMRSLRYIVYKFLEMPMSDLLERKLGDLIQDLEKQREQLRRDLDKVNAQLELIAGLVGSGTKQSAKGQQQAMAPAEKASPNGRGRPKNIVAASKASARKPARQTKSSSGRTLKEELFMIAKSHGGVLRVREASLSLVRAGRYADVAQASANIHAAIKYYKKNFVRDASARGTYKVKA
jgi:hypothetical protein